MSESARLNNKLYQLQQCQIQSALLRAHQIYGTTCSGISCNTPKYRQETPRESDYLASKACPNIIIGNTCALSSELTQQRIRNTIDSSIDPTNPLARFSHYDRPLPPPVCPPVPPEVLNAFLPKASVKCPVPNKPSFDLV